jgi:NitT/TauT family transport system substrate-binding protein
MQWSKVTLTALVLTASNFLTPMGQAQTKSVTVGYYPGIIQSVALFLAETKGYFKSEGLDITLQAVQSGPLMNSQIGSGAIDIAVQPPSNVGVASERGLDQVYIAGNIIMPWVLIARSEIKLPNKGKYPDVMRDLKGLKWGVYGRGSDGEMFMRVMAGEAGLDVEKDMAWIGVGGPATGLPALKAQQIDAYLTLDPAPAVAEAGGYGQPVMDLSKGEGPSNFKGIFYNGYVTLRKTADANPAMPEAFVRALAKSFCWIKDEKNFKEFVGLTKTKVPTGDLKDPQIEALVRANIPGFMLRIPADDFKVWNGMLIKAKILKNELDATKLLAKSVPKEEPKC